MSVLVFQHSLIAGPARLSATLRDHGFRLDVRRCDLGDPVPEDHNTIDAVIVLGGLQNVPDGHAWLEQECAFIRGAHERSIPVVGICLGAQMIAHAFGGGIGVMNTPELGMTEVELVGAAQSDPILAGVPNRFHINETHLQEVRAMPEGAVLLASSEGCKHQAFRLGMRTYAFQFHFEFDKPTMLEATRGMPAELSKCGLSQDAISHGVEEHYERAACLANRICVNIVNCLIPRRAGAVRV